MSKNTMHVNGEEVEYTDEQMRDFYEGFLEGMSKTMFNHRQHWRVKSKEYRDEITKLQKEKLDLQLKISDYAIERINDDSKSEIEILTVCNNQLQAAYTNELLRNGELAQEMKSLVSALEFIASGCLVAPDGGSPTLQDAIDAAKSTLNIQEPNLIK